MVEKSPVGTRGKLEARKKVGTAREHCTTGVAMPKQTIRVTSAEYVRDYQLRLRFSDGGEKIIDFSRWLQGEVFRPLAQKSVFKRFFIAGGTVCWPNGADIAPETLHATESVRSSAA